MTQEEAAELGRMLLRLVEKAGVLELENVTITAEELSLVLQPLIQAVVPTLRPPEVTQLIEARFEPPIQTYPGEVAEVLVGATKAEGGSRAYTLKVGGEKYPPFYTFEGLNPNRPVLAFDIFDMKIPMARAIRQHFEEVMDDPAEWAKKCVQEFKADLVNLNLVSTDPDLKDASPRDGAKTLERVLQAVDVPIMVGGSGNKEKDPLVLEACAEVGQGERLILNNAMLDIDYKRVARAARENGHVLVAFTSMNINDQKKLNSLLLEDEKVPRSQLLMDPTTGALGYGLEYTLSNMERMRLAALEGDRVLQQPFIGPVSNAWGAREAWIKADEWGPREYRGPLWETVTAITLLLSGCDVFLMSHPAAHAIMKSVVASLFGEGEARPLEVDWVTTLG
ncbi:MAG: CO dehydrogenase/acetyl-CoA synthase subunit delta [Candidatus Bathyarchaeia archaeon]